MTTQTKLILITGATGRQGRAVANALREKGWKFREENSHADGGLSKVFIGTDSGGRL